MASAPPRETRTPGSAEGRVPPHDLEAEQSVLGSVLLDPAAITRVLDFLEPIDFYRENHGQVFRAAVDLFRQGEPIDNITLADQLTKMGVLERVGGRAQLAMLAEAVPTAANIEYYARIVKARAQKRRLITAGGQVTGLGFDDAIEADEALNLAQQAVFDIADQRVRTRLEELYPLLKAAMERVDAQMASGTGVLGVPSGWHDLDRLTSGFKDGDLVIIAARPSMGKALALDTPIPTPDGWRTMGSLRVGDQVFDERGAPCTVTMATPVMLDHECFEVVFSDGERLVADADHQWSVRTRAARKRRGAAEVLTTRAMAGRVRAADGRLNFAIPTCAPLQYPWRDLPLSPYVLGAWLGDGHSSVAAIRVGDPELVLTTGGRGESVPVAVPPHPGGLGVLGHEHIPRHYLEAGLDQRVALAQGLMDTAGHIDALGNAEYASANRQLAEDMLELMTGLGHKPTLTVDHTIDHGPRYRVRFKPGDRQRRIVEIRPTDSVSVRCITVDSPNHLYLAGRGCVPTHNTSMALNIALHAAVSHKVPTAIFSLEMSKEQLVERLLCQQARIDSQRLHRGLLSDREYEQLVGALQPLESAPIYIDESPVLDEVTMMLKARQAKAQLDIGLIIVDYLQLMKGHGGKDDNRVQEVSSISRALKAIARELKVPVLALSQLSRGPEARPNKRPMLSDLRDSGSIEQDSDLVIFLYRDDYYNEKSEEPGIAEVIIAKHRNGPVGAVKLRFRKDQTLFYSLETRRGPAVEEEE